MSDSPLLRRCRTFPVWRSVALSAAVALLGATSVACAQDQGLQQPFAEVEGDIHPIAPPDAEIDRLPDNGGAAPEQGQSHPCDISDEILAACLPDVTAMTATGDSRGLTATSDGTLWDIRPGHEPEPLLQAQAPVRQLLPSSSVEEDGQVHVLLDDGSLHRLTLLPSGGTDWRETGGPGDTVAIVAGPAGPENIRINDPGIELQALCDTPEGAPPIASVILDGQPTLVVFYGMMIEPLTGVDFDDSIGGCAASADEVVVAVPGAQRVVSIPLALDSGSGTLSEEAFWSVAGSPEVLVDGMYGHVSTVTIVDAEGVGEVWAGTANRVLAEGGPGESDDRVVRFPLDGAAGGSPD